MVNNQELKLNTNYMKMKLTINLRIIFCKTQAISGSCDTSPHRFRSNLPECKVPMKHGKLQILS